MSTRKALSWSAFVVLPLALLFIYWEYTYFNGHAIERTIPSFPIFLALAALLVLEALFRYEKGVSQRHLTVWDQLFGTFYLPMKDGPYSRTE